MITTILSVYGLVLIFAIGYKLGNPFHEFSWIQVFFWPFLLIVIAYEVLDLLCKHKISPLVELIMVFWFNKKYPANETEINRYYQKCLRGDVSYAKWRTKAVEKLAKQNNIILSTKSDYSDYKDDK